jgi:hypothetical protein
MHSPRALHLLSFRAVCVLSIAAAQVRTDNSRVEITKPATERARGVRPCKITKQSVRTPTLSSRPCAASMRELDAHRTPRDANSLALHQLATIAR